MNEARWQKVESQILEHRALFAGCGAVVAGWRWCAGRRYGPYFRVAYRDRSRQCSIYLGVCAELAERARQLLASLQSRCKRKRLFRRLNVQGRAALRRQKDRLRRLLRMAGYWLKGWEPRRLYPGADLARCVAAFMSWEAALRAAGPVHSGG